MVLHGHCGYRLYPEVQLVSHLRLRRQSHGPWSHAALVGRVCVVCCCYMPSKLLYAFKALVSLPGYMVFVQRSNPRGTICRQETGRLFCCEVVYGIWRVVSSDQHTV